MVPIPTDLKQISDVIDNEVFRKDMYDKSVKKVYAIDTTALVGKTEYDAKISNIESNFFTTSDYKNLQMK